MYGGSFSNKSGRKIFVCMEGHLEIHQEVKSVYRGPFRNKSRSNIFEVLIV